MSRLDEVRVRLEKLFEKADVRPVEWVDGRVRWIDVTRLPWEERYVESKSVERIAEAIRVMEIRGAPAIGVAAALGVAVAVYNASGGTEDLARIGEEAIRVLSKTRPTAYNLFWALERMRRRIRESIKLPPEEFKREVLAEALEIQAEDIEANIRMGEYGAELINDGETILTHCNAGALATAGYGTALGVIRTAWRMGKNIKVIATETRPLLQGARLTAWELKREGIPFKLITDNAVGYVFSKGMVDKVVVGADRILLSGHVANKIGTYMIALAAWRHKKEFYVAAPTSTIDPKSSDIVIEMRDPREVTVVMGRLRIAPEGVEALNPAFDITPPELVTCIITERGIARPPYNESLRRLCMGSE